MSANEPVATIECPVRKCAETVNVFKYAARTDKPGRTRFAGKFYCRCKVHGRTEDCTDYVLNSESIKWLNGPPQKESAPALGAPEKTASTALPASSPPAVKAAVKPTSTNKAASASKAPTDKSDAKPSTGWGFFRSPA